MPSIFIYTADRLPRSSDGDLFLAALAEDGVQLAFHVSKNADMARRDMGLTTKNKHDKYEHHYGGDFTLVDLIELDDNQLSAHQQFKDAHGKLFSEIRAKQAKEDAAWMSKRGDQH